MACTHLFLLPLLAASLSQEHISSEASIADADQATNTPGTVSCGSFVLGGACKGGKYEVLQSTPSTDEECLALCVAKGDDKSCCYHKPDGSKCEYMAEGAHFVYGGNTIRSSTDCKKSEAAAGDPPACTVMGPSYTINPSGGRANGAAWPTKVDTVQGCLDLCTANPSCHAFHYYGPGDPYPNGVHDCYQHSSGTVQGPLSDGRMRYAYACEAQYRVNVDTAKDGMKCGDVGSSHRIFDLRNAQASLNACKQACESNSACVAFSGTFDSWCIGCDAELSQAHTGTIAYKKGFAHLPKPMYKTNDNVPSFYKQCMDPEYEPITTEADCRQMATDFIGGRFRSAGGHGHWPPGCFRYNGVNGKDVYLGTNSGGTGHGGHVMVCKLIPPTPAPTTAAPTPAPTTAAQYFASAECTVGDVCVNGSWVYYYKDTTSELCMERCAAGYHGMIGLGMGNCTHFTFSDDGTCVLYSQCERGSGSITIGSGPASKIIADTAQLTTCNAPYSPPVTADWVLISSQDRRKAGFNSNARNTYLENEENPDANTYMIVGKLTKDDWKIDGKYHFKLVYYNDNENDGDELEWTQTNWLTDQRVTGSEAIGPDNLKRSQGCATFYGLAKCSGGQAVFDGDGYGSGCWWNCVGCVHSHGGGMPAWNSQIRKLYKLYIWGNPRTLA